MTSTVLEISKRKNDYEFLKDTFSVNLQTLDQPLSIAVMEPGYKKSLRSLDFISDSKKVLLSPVGSFYHFVVDHAGSSLDLYAEDPDIEFIIDTHMLDGIPGSEGRYLLYSFLELLRHHNIKYQTFSRVEASVLNINNFYVKHYHHQNGNPQKAMFEMYCDFLGMKTRKPTKNVYLSRLMANVMTNFSDDPEYMSRKRIDDEKKLEDYFRGIGFEIVYPEQFRSFNEQIEFFYDVKTLASLTSSGITNAAFMQPGQTVIEIETPIIIDYPDEDNYPFSMVVKELHHFYILICFRKNHKRISIPNQNKSADEVISILDNDDLVRSIARNSGKGKWFRK